MQKTSKYCLADFLREAKVPNPPKFAEELTMNLIPRPYQVVGLNRILMNNRFGLFDDPGIGKTLPLQAAALYLVSEGNKVLLLMPPILLGQYMQTLCETFDSPERFIKWHVLVEGPEKRQKLIDIWEREGWPDLLLMTYELFAKLTRVNPAERRRPYLANLFRDQYKVVHCDEAHKLCGPSTILHDTLSWHCGDPDESMLCLATGTPMPNTPLDAYGLIHFVNHKKYKDYRQFVRMHAKYITIKIHPVKTATGKMITERQVLDGYEDVVTIRQNLYKNARRIIKEQVLSLREPQIMELPVILSRDHLTLYKRLERERILELDGEIVLGGIQEQRLRQALLRIVTNPEAFLDGKKIENNILNKIFSLLDSHNIAHPLENGFPNKAIIFCNLRATAAFLAQQLKAYGPVVLNGETSNKERVRQAFLSDPNCRVLIANPESAGFGLNFQGVSCTAIFAEPTSVPGEFKQAMERIYRSGQEYVVMVYILRAMSTIAPKATKLMLEKAESINLVNRDEVQFSTYLKRG